jgi:hypothetical protein
MGSNDFCNFLFADIYVEEGAVITKHEYKMSIFLISDIKGLPLPDFSLEKSGALDILKDIRGLKDINFEGFPEFSSEYYLEGKDEKAIREFFDEKILKLFEKEKGYYVECKNNVILVHRSIVLMSIEEIKNTISFIDKFTKIIAEK